jgi:hypothetical protein
MVPGRLFENLGGQPGEAIERFEHAMRLSPLDSEMFRMQAGIAMAHLVARRFDAACAWAEKALRDVPFFALSAAAIAASCAHAGRMDEARRVKQHLRKFNPTLRLARLDEWLPFRRPDDLAMFAEGLRRAGLPE